MFNSFADCDVEKLKAQLVLMQLQRQAYSKSRIYELYGEWVKLHKPKLNQEEAIKELLGV